MQIDRATGVILRVRPLTETSLIVHWLTREWGRLALVAKGARRPQSPYRGRLDLFHEAEFTFSRSRRSDLHTLRELMLAQTHPHLREDWGKLKQASYCAMLIEDLCESDTPIPEIFDLFVQVLRSIGASSLSPWTVLSFEWSLLGTMGLAFPVGDLRLSAEARQFFEQSSNQGVGETGVEGLGLRQEGVGEVAGLLGRQVLEACGRLPRGRGEALSTE